MTADPQTKTYGNDDPALTYQITSGSNVAGDTFTGALTRDAGENVGSYDIKKGTLSLGDNYDLTFVAGELEITKAQLLVNADSKSKTLNAADPTFTWDLSGFKNGEDAGTAGVSGLAACVRAPGEGVGTYAITCLPGTLTAANYSFAQGTPGVLSIGFRWDGFLQPVNDTAHQVGVQLSKFKLGQTVPLKFKLKDVNGVVVTQAAAPTFKATRIGGCIGDTVLETVGTVSPNSGSTFAWDGAQYHYNWSTKGLESGLWRVRAQLADGNTGAYVDICLSK